MFVRGWGDVLNITTAAGGMRKQCRSILNNGVTKALEYDK